MDTHGCSSSAGAPACPRLRWSEQDQRVAARRRHAGDERAVGDLGHGRWPSTQSGPWNSACRIRQRCGFGRHDRGAGTAVGLPPAAPVRDEAQRPVAAPGGLADRLARTRRPPGAPAPPPRRVSSPCAAQAARASGDDQDRRGVPGHVRVVPRDDGHAATGRIGTRRAEEVVPVEQRATHTARAHAWTSATTRRTGRRLPARWISRTASTQSPSPWRSARRGCATSPSGGGAVSGLGAAPGRRRLRPGRRRTTPAGPTGPRRRRHRPIAAARGTAPPRRTR